MAIKTLVFLFITSLAFAQTPIGADTLMKACNIKTRTQLACDANGENCKPHIISHYDSTGCLILKKTFAGDSLVETNRYEYNPSRLAHSVYTTYGNGNEFLNIKIHLRFQK
ncbi:MAG: hypothetical protein LRY55_09875 [Leadbetterella sp.]|nr:hypothetical protein [Leadbetterella sp.]